MPERIQAIFVTPGLAFARLGGSATPQCAYDWIDTRAPRADGETSVAPAWSIAVQPDGSPQPFLPDAITFRDGELIRPVAPFFEIWARVGEPGSDASTWREAPLTPAMLEADGLALGELGATVTARNLKAARRTGNLALAFGTFPPLALPADDVSRHPIFGTSPPAAADPMIPSGRSIPLGSVQWLRSVVQPRGQPWSNIVDVQALRFRFTPASGLFYGPPEAGQASAANGRSVAAVRPENAFLSATAGWRGTPTNERVEPADTYDAINPAQSTGPSLGVVDDTCEVHFDVVLRRGADRSALSAKAVAFVGPPDFAPDRRPFLSVADELNDREAAATSRNDALDGGALDRWVGDLFERIYETVSLFNLDNYRAERAAPVPPARLATVDLDRGHRPAPARAMGGRDGLRSPVYANLPAPVDVNPLPLSEHARSRHRQMSDLQNLEALVALDPARIRSIVRPPFAVEENENGDITSMRMPPFMRQSNALPLTLARWQYELLMRWVDETRTRLAARGIATASDMAGRESLEASPADLRRARVLARVDAAEGSI